MRDDDARRPRSPERRTQRPDEPPRTPDPPPRVPHPEPDIPVPHPGSPGPEPNAVPETERRRRQGHELDEAGEESFPASDPPAVSRPDPPPLPGPHS